eukprot:m.62510 g.62510  ORF g.62510 m.62510 type:complete len:79 (+) comp8033_c4_seq1:358-594(+)
MHGLVVYGTVLVPKAIIGSSLWNECLIFPVEPGLKLSIRSVNESIHIIRLGGFRPFCSATKLMVRNNVAQTRLSNQYY